MEDHLAFHFADGTNARSIEELRVALQKEPRELTAPHVSETRNDYAAWIRHVHHDDELADLVAAAHSVDEVIAALSTHEHGPEPRQALDVPAFQEHDVFEHAEQEPPRPPLPAAAGSPLPKAPTTRAPRPPQEAPSGPAVQREPVHVHELPPPLPETTHDVHKRFSLREFVVGFVLGVIVAIIVYVLGSMV